MTDTTNSRPITTVEELRTAALAMRAKTPEGDVLETRMRGAIKWSKSELSNLSAINNDKHLKQLLAAREYRVRSTNPSPTFAPIPPKAKS